MRNLLPVIVGVVSAASMASADAPRYSRKQELKLELAPSERVKPIQPSHATREPAVTADDVLAIQQRADPLRQEQEAILIQLIHDTPETDPDKPDYLFRLAEQYAIQLRFWRLKAIGQTVERYAR